MRARHKAFILSAISFAVLSISSTQAMAQSSVTLYGVIDQGIDYTSNAGGKAAWKMQSGDLQGNRWGLTGKEDLGGGRAAVFTLENGFDSTNGTFAQGGRMFGRQAFVGLSDTRLGTLTFGRQYDSLVDYLAPLTANGGWGGGTFARPFDNDNTANSFRLNNAVKYTAPLIGGLSFGGLYAFSNSAGAFSDNRAFSAGLQYVQGPLTLATAYVDVRRGGSNNMGALPADSLNFFSAQQRIWGAGATYRLGLVTVGLNYTHTSLTQPSGVAGMGNFQTLPDSLKFDNYEVNAKYQITPAFFMGAMYTITEANLKMAGNSMKPKWQQAAFVADYYLSKRTDVYLEAGYQRVSGDTTGTLLDPALVSGAAAGASDRSQVLARLALKHRF